MGDAKILVEVDLDKPFPKLIVLDVKQGNIYLVEVEYSWIPTTCERCRTLVIMRRGISSLLIQKILFLQLNKLMYQVKRFQWWI